MPIFPISLAISNPPRPPPLFSFSQSITGSNRLLYLSNGIRNATKITTVIRMGGGPRTYPGGVSKWQWKRMQAKKAKQLLKARLCRERQIYEMRKRAELKAAVSELERPWEVVEKAPNLFSVGADEQVKVLADRFQRPGGFDLWTEKDGPQLFETVDELPSARFFPKGVVHSVKPYRSITGSEGSSSLDSEVGNEIGTSFQEDDLKTPGGLLTGNQELGHSNGQKGKTYEGKFRNREKGRNLQSSKRSPSLGSEAGNGIETSFQVDDFNSHRRSSNRKLRSGSVSEGEANSDYSDTDNYYQKSSMVPSSSNNGRKFRYRDNGRSLESSKRELNSGQIGLDRRQRVPSPQMHNGNRQYGKGKDSRRSKGSYSEVYDMSLEQDGSYRFKPMKTQSN
ncbi:putative DEAD-box ATP-dependent RNA helicase 33, partial [Cucurbita argyrosperma subsp. sororia]